MMSSDVQVTTTTLGNDHQMGTTANTNQQQQQSSNNNTTSAADHKRSSKESLNPITCPFTHTVKEAVAIAAGKKESDGDDDDGRNIRSNMLCYLYWLLVVLILGLISFTVWLSIQLARRHSEINDHKRDFEFDDIFNTIFHPKSFDVTWVRSDAYVFRSDDGSLLMFNITKNLTEKFMDSSIFEERKTTSFTVSKDLKHVLIKYDVNKLWRYSDLAKYVIYDRQGSRRVHPLGEDLLNSHEKRYLQHAELAPTSSAVVFVYKNNLFFQESPKKQTVQMTFSGVEGEVFNGVNDWTYEGILSKSSAIWWSPDSRYVCYMSINDSNVSKFEFIQHKGVTGKLVSIPHPKAYPASPLPKVTLKVADTDQLKDEQHHDIIPSPPEFESTEYYVVQVVWQQKSKVLVVWHNRAQNQSITTVFDMNDLKHQLVHRQSVSDGWIDPAHQILPINGDSKYFTILPKFEEGGNTWDHLTLIDYQIPEKDFLTNGHEEIKEILAFNEETQDVFYLSSYNNIMHRHLLRLNLDTRKSKCMTCNISSDCEYVSASFGPGAKYYVLGCLGPGVPSYRLRDINFSINMLLEDNRRLSEALQGKILPEKKYKEIEIGNDFHAIAEILLPQEEGSKKFPLLVQAFGEPGQQMVTKEFRLGWDHYMAVKEEVVVARIDIRGSRGKGSAHRYGSYKKLAVTDTDDLLLAGLKLKESEYVDHGKVAIWGWGMAGLTAMYALANETDIYPCGISGGALLDPQFYDAPTFERYMGFSTPQENEAGYSKMDLLKKFGFIRNKKLALIQGLADDNIRFTSGSSLMNALSTNDILYRYKIYRDLNSYELTRHKNVFHFMTDFLKQDCFSYFWKHETKTWIVDKTAKKEKFRIKQFCV